MFSKTDIEHYFAGFRQEQLFLITLGAAALVVAIVFYTALKTQWYRGFALPLAVFAILFAGAGYSNYKKTDALRVRAVYNYDMHPEELKTKELPRVKETQQNLNVLIYVNISIIIASFLIFFYFKNKQENNYYLGTAASLFLMAVISIIIYSVLKRSADPYINGIENFTKEIIVK